MELNHNPERKNFFEASYSKISKILTPFFLKTSLTPNQVTAISGIFGVIGAALLLSQDYKLLILGAIFLQLFSILDLVDGDIARAKKMQSNWGWWLDIFFDKFNDFLIILCISLGVYFKTQDYKMLVLGIFLMGFVFSIQFILLLNETLFYRKRITNDFIFKDARYKNIQSKIKLFLLINYFRNHISLQHNSFLFIVSLFAFLNLMEIGLIFLTIHAAISLVIIIIINFIKIK